MQLLSKINKLIFENKNLDIFRIILDDAASAADFKLAQRCLLSLPYEKASCLPIFASWGKEVAEGEKDLLLVRFILLFFNQKIADGKK